MTRTTRQAVLLIHGIGEQRPMDTLRSFVRAVWTLDTDIHHPFAGHDVWSKPDSVDHNGNLLISGEQDILVNKERQRIALSGLVRQADIGPDNTVVSSRIANARIDFKGDGLLARQQSPGLLGLIFRLFGLN